MPVNIAGTLSASIGAELKNKIMQEYAPLIKSLEKKSTDSPLSGKESMIMLNDDSLFNKYLACSKRSLILEDRLYVLSTFGEYLSKFQKSMEPKFYIQIKKILDGTSTTSSPTPSTPEDFSKFLTDNSDKINPKALPLMRNKIWHSMRSSKLFLDAVYWIPEYVSNLNDWKSSYEKLIEMKIKLDATGLPCKI